MTTRSKKETAAKEDASEYIGREGEEHKFVAPQQRAVKKIDKAGMLV
jgi:hypothetical protein